MYLTQGCNFGEIGVCLVIDYTMNESTTISPLINDMRETYDEVKSLNWYFGVVSDVLQNRDFPAAIFEVLETLCWKGGCEY